MNGEQLEVDKTVFTTSERNSLTVSDSQGRAGYKEVSSTEQSPPQIDKKWYVMRDLKRPNAKHFCYAKLKEENFRVFLPKEKRVVVKNGKRKVVEEYLFYNLFFVYSDRKALDAQVAKYNTLHYIYKRGVFNVVLTVPIPEMERFIEAVEGYEDPKYYLCGEILPNMLGKVVHVTGGPLAGFEGRLIKATGRGAKKRLIVELPGILAVGVVVRPEHIEELRRKR